jgi:hypothetical protein
MDLNREKREKPRNLNSRRFWNICFTMHVP